MKSLIEDNLAGDSWKLLSFTAMDVECLSKKGKLLQVLAKR